MTKLKIKEDVSHGNPIDSAYPFEDIRAGDMFYNYDMDWLVAAIEHEDSEFVLVELTSGETIPDEGGEYFEDVFDHLTRTYGEWYPVSKAKIKFTVGE